MPRKTSSWRGLWAHVDFATKVEHLIVLLNFHCHFDDCQWKPPFGSVNKVSCCIVLYCIVIINQRAICKIIFFSLFVAAAVRIQQTLYRETHVQTSVKQVVSPPPHNQMASCYSSGSGVLETWASYPVQPEVAFPQNTSSAGTQRPRHVYTGHTLTCDW